MAHAIKEALTLSEPLAHTPHGTSDFGADPLWRSSDKAPPQARPPRTPQQSSDGQVLYPNGNGSCPYRGTAGRFEIGSGPSSCLASNLVMALDSVAASTQRIGPPQRGQVSTSAHSVPLTVKRLSREL